VGDGGPRSGQRSSLDAKAASCSYLLEIIIFFI
jgi:hypothetical protein